MGEVKTTHKTGWANIEHPSHLKIARGVQEQFNQQRRKKDGTKNDLIFLTAEDYMETEED